MGTCGATRAVAHLRYAALTPYLITFVNPSPSLPAIYLVQVRHVHLVCHFGVYMLAGDGRHCGIRTLVDRDIEYLTFIT